MFAGDFAAPGALRRGISPSAGGELLCPWRLVVAMAQATFSWPFGPIHLESACLRFRLTAKTAPAPLFLLFPANPLRWASPGVTMDWEKRHRGRLRMSASRSYSPFPGPHYGGHVFAGFHKISGAWKSEWVSKFPPGHWALAWWKIGADAVSVPRLALTSR